MLNKETIVEKAKKYFESEEIRSQFIADLASLVSIDSVAGKAEGDYPYGSKCARALETGLELGKKYGFETENHEYHCGSIIWGNHDRQVGIAAHLDVVPCGNGWTMPPYELTVKDGALYGRGVQDDKGPFCISLYAMRFLSENGYKLPFSIRLICGSDEEVGSTDLEYFSKMRKAPWFSFTPDAEFPVSIGEKDIVALQLDMGMLPDGVTAFTGGTVSNAVPDRAYASVVTDRALASTDCIEAVKCDGGYRLTAFGTGAHAAEPYFGVNAIVLMTKYLTENGFTCPAFDFMARALSEFDGESLGIETSDSDFGKLTCVGSVLKNENGRLKLIFNIRAIPVTDEDAMRSRIVEHISEFGGKIDTLSVNRGYHVSADDGRIKALTEACEFVLGRECKPYTMGGGTYARELKNCVAFGAVLPDAYTTGDCGGAHQRDECFKLEDAEKAFCIYVLSLLALGDGIDDGSITE